MINIAIAFLGIIAGVIVNVYGYAKLEESSEECIYITKWQHVRFAGCLIIASSLVWFITKLI